MKNCKLRVSVAVTAILTSFALAAAPKPGKGEAKPTIRGLVRAIDGKPIEGATVLVAAAPQGSGFPRFLNEAASTPTRVTTAKDGTFEAPLSKDKEFCVRVDAPELAPWTGRKTPAGASVQVTLRRGEKATGRVIDRETSRPLAGATVYARSRRSPAGASQRRSRTASSSSLS